jgi:hypothetical protein
MGKFTVGPPGTAEAVLAIDNDNPAAPNTGKALLRRFRFEVCFVLDMGASKRRTLLNASFWAPVCLRS